MALYEGAIWAVYYYLDVYDASGPTLHSSAGILLKEGVTKF